MSTAAFVPEISASSLPAIPPPGDEVLAEVRGRVGFLTLNRPRALNALSLGMVRHLTRLLTTWRDDPAILAVAIRGMGREGPFGAFCAGGDIRFLHQAGLAGSPDLDAFFTEEYTLNHLIHVFPKPYLAFLDGIVMGGGMGISGHGRGPIGTGSAGSMRLVTERTRMAMPETAIGLFPDVGGGYFLSRCPGATGERLALTGDSFGAQEAMGAGLADRLVPTHGLPELWEALGQRQADTSRELAAWFAMTLGAETVGTTCAEGLLDAYFSKNDVLAIVSALETADDPAARAVAATLRKRSPLMLHVVLEQLRRARTLSLADDLRMERGLVHQCFYLRPGASETLEGIRALAVDKDHAPRWNPPRIEDVTPAMVQAYFDPPWAPHEHPLRDLG